MAAPRTLLTLAERVPGRPVGDTVWEVITAVPTVVHPSVCIGVDLGQLEERREMNESNPIPHSGGSDSELGDTKGQHGAT